MFIYLFIFFFFLQYLLCDNFFSYPEKDIFPRGAGSKVYASRAANSLKS